MYKIQTVRFSSEEAVAGHHAAWELLFRMLKEMYGITPKKQDFQRSRNGKPYLASYPNIHFSLSHTSDAAVCVVASHPIGVDCEKKERPISEKVRNRMLNGFSGNDREAVYLWTCLESRVKLAGTSVFAPGFPYDRLFDGTCVFSREDMTLDGGGYTVTVCERAEDAAFP